VTRPRIPCSDPGLHEDAAAVRAAIARVVASGWFILGPEVTAFEEAFAAASGARHAIGVGNGTDAIALVLRALGIGPGDEVITTPLSAAYTALAILMAGARPVFADIDPERHTLSPAAVRARITTRTRAILPVHLYGQAADMRALEAIAAQHRLALVEDCCQAHLATSEGRPVGTIGVAGAFSFYPTKNLGALGDGGAVITNDAGLADRLRQLRNGGQRDRYHHEFPGVNSRLDEMQAAILHARLPYLAAWTERRRAVAAAYRGTIASAILRIPREADPGHVYHLFIVRSASRSALQSHLRARGIETLVHYPVPITRQAAFADARPGECPEADAASAEVLSLPCHPALTPADLEEVATAISDYQER
jgi:dTDP-4-amino-4,6-dideoxygalactose transaminase